VFGYAQQGYKEKLTADGKVVLGLSQAEAFNKYGSPSLAKDNLWYYDTPEKFYVFLSKPLEVFLYPRFCKGYVGAPLELKILAGTTEMNDVAAQSELFFSQPGNFNVAGNNVLLPRKVGEYQVMAKYNGVYSNTCFISIVAKNEKTEEGAPVSIDIFPYKPYTNVNTKIDFCAFGTFVSIGQYSIRDISGEAQWFVERNGIISKLKNSSVVLDSAGRAKVFCTYRGGKSLPQDIEVGDASIELYHYLKQIAIIPAYVSVPDQAKINFHVFASYGDNRVGEVTTKVKWSISDKSILKRESDNIFAANSVGITQLQASLGTTQSLPAKVAVSPPPMYEEKEKKDKNEQEIREQNQPLGDLLQDIRNDIKDLKIKVAKEDRFRYLKIIPDYCDIRVGEEKQLSVFGVKQNNTEEDITILGKWRSLDENMATVKAGLVKAVATGETKVCFQFQDIKTECVGVIVREPKLISLTVLPLYLKIAIGEEGQLKAEGSFGDSSRKDLTALVSWIFDKPSIVKIDKGKVAPIRAGKTKIYAQYSEVQSSQVDVEVIKEKYWLIKLIAKILFIIFLILFILYVYLYIVTEQNKASILKLYNDPRAFVVALYGNLNKVMAIFNEQQKFYTPPLFLAILIDKKYGISSNLFFKFTQHFEEAKYSNHFLSQDESAIALENYNQILKLIGSQNKKTKNISNYLKALFSKTPLIINRTGGLSKGG